ncbi:MAG TPA: hypothetical protein VGL13_09805 [Polyangiaceae bacterium]
MRQRPFVRSLTGAAFLAALGAAACNGGSFQSGAEITGLRVLAVQKTPAYPQPGETSQLDLLYWDGRAASGMGHDVQVCFFDCFNPLGDLYYNCYPQIGAQIAARLQSGGTMADFCPPASSTSTGSDGGTPDDASFAEAAGSNDGGVDESGTVDAGTSDDAGADEGSTDIGADAAAPDAGFLFAASPTRHHQIAIPSDIIDMHGTASGSDPYGLAYVLFTACTGHLGLRQGATANDLPLTCLDDDGKELTVEDFVPGYASLYVYANRTNANPVIRNLLFAGQPMLGATGSDPRRVPVCTTGDCEIDLKVDVDPASAEQDPGSTDINGHVLHEEIWVNFYATRGEFTRDVRLINDAMSGWNDDNATQFKVPGTAGPVHLWAVVHDNRGGVSWSEGDIVVGGGDDGGGSEDGSGAD